MPGAFCSLFALLYFIKSKFQVQARIAILPPCYWTRLQLFDIDHSVDSRPHFRFGLKSNRYTVCQCSCSPPLMRILVFFYFSAHAYTVPMGRGCVRNRYIRSARAAACGTGCRPRDILQIDAYRIPCHHLSVTLSPLIDRRILVRPPPPPTGAGDPRLPSPIRSRSPFHDRPLPPS